MTNRSMGVWTCGFFVGLGAGMLTAPQSGKRTRSMLRGKAEEVEAGITEAAGEAADRGRQMADHGKRLVDETVREFSTGVKSAVNR